MGEIISTMKTACAYIRVSTDKQDELSPDAQKRLIIEYAKKNNISILKEYILIENGISGKKANKRPLFMKMIGLAKSSEHPFDIILVWKFSRFARNQEESIVYKSLLKKNNVDVMSISEPLIDGPFGSLIERIIEWMDEYYSIRLSGEVVRGMTEKAMRGGYQSRPPIGYKMNKDINIPYIIEKDAVLVRRIYTDYAYQCKSFLEIARDVNALGYRTQRNKPFEQRTIRYILENPYYIGKVRWNRQSHVDHTIKDKSEWIIADATHEKIIEESLFNLVQDQIVNRTRPYKSRSASSVNHWLVGMIRCSSCRSNLLACTKGKNDGTFYFQCGAYNKGSCNVSHAIKSKILEEGIIDSFQRVFDVPIFRDVSADLGVMDVQYEIKNSTTVNDSSDLDLYKKQLKRLSDKEFRIKQAYRDGIDTIHEYEENKQLLQDEHDQLIEQIHKVISVQDDKKQTTKEIHSIYDIIKDETCDKRIRGNALRSIVNNIVYDKPNDTLEVYFYLSK